MSKEINDLINAYNAGEAKANEISKEKATELVQKLKSVVITDDFNKYNMGFRNGIYTAINLIKQTFDL